MENKPIPTAEEYLAMLDERDGTLWTEDDKEICKAFIEFAKLHCQEQVKVIKKELEEILETFGISLTNDFKLEQTDNNLIDDAYPLENIK